MTHYPQDEALKSPSSILSAFRASARRALGTINGTGLRRRVDSIDDLHTVNGNIEVYDGAAMSTRKRTNATFISNWHTLLEQPRIG